MGNLARKAGGFLSVASIYAATGGFTTAFARGLGLLGLQSLFARGSRQEGARLHDPGVQLSQEGAEKIIFFGYNRQSLNIVWPTGPAITEHTHEDTVSGKGTTQTNTSYSYTATVLGLGARQTITRATRIKINARVLYDYNDGSEQGFTFAYDDAGFWYGETNDGIIIRFYPGTLDQPVDSKIESVHGVGQWTNYPGCWGFFFENVPVSGGGPNITVEVYNAVTDLDEVILQIAGWAGYIGDDFDLSALAGMSVMDGDREGFVVDSQKTAAEALGELCDTYHIYLVEEDGVIRAKKKSVARLKTFASGELRIYSPGSDVPDTAFPQADEKNLPHVLAGTARNPDREYNVGTRRAVRLLTGSKRQASESWNSNLKGNHLEQLCRIRLAQMHAGAIQAQGTFGLENFYLSPGDAIGIPGPDGVLDTCFETINYPLFGPIGFTATVRDLPAFSIPLPGDTAALDRRLPEPPGAPILFKCETVPFSREDPDTFGPPIVVAAVTQTTQYAWGTIALRFDRFADDAWLQRYKADTSQKAVIGELTEDYAPRPVTDGFVAAATMSVKLYHGELNSATLTAAKLDANMMLWETGMICSFVNATLTDTDDHERRSYDIDTILSGRFTSDDLDVGTLAAGTRFVMFTDSEGNRDTAVQVFHYPAEWRGIIPGRVRAELGDYGTSQEIEPLHGTNLYEPKPILTRVSRAGGVKIEGRSRNRNPGTTFDCAPLMTAPSTPSGFPFRITLTSGVTSRVWTKYTTHPYGRFTDDDALLISDAELTTAFGSVPAEGDIDGTIQIIGQWGPGRAREFENV